MVGDGVMLVDLAGSTTIDKMLTNEDLKVDLNLCPNFVKWATLWVKLFPPKTCRSLFFRIVLPKNKEEIRSSAFFTAVSEYNVVDEDSGYVSAGASLYSSHDAADGADGAGAEPAKKPRKSSGGQNQCN